MLKGFKQWLDRSIIKLAANAVDQREVSSAVIAPAQDLLSRPNLLSIDDVQPAQLHFITPTNFTFPSPQETPSQINNLVHGKFFPCGTTPLGTILLVHGWNAELHYKYGLPKVAACLNRSRLDALLVELPFHGHRRPRDPSLPHNFISENIPLMLRLVQQSLADFQALLLWAQHQTGRPTGIWGFSLGGWLAGLYCAVSPLPQAVVLTSPISRLDQAINDLAFCEPIRRALRKVPLDIRPLNLDTKTPAIPASRIAIAESDYDQFVSSRSLAELSQAWHLSSHLHYPDSHITILLSRRHFRQTAHWCATQLGRD